MPMEEWKDIEGYEGMYQVSNLGNVRSLDRVVIRKDGTTQFNKGRVLKQNTTKCGYNTIPLYKNGKTKGRFVHRLVAQAFIPNPDNLPQVNHINEMKTCNRADNLEWMSAKDNTNYGTGVQRSAEKRKNDPKRSKKVYQYTLDEQLIKIWDSTAECGRNGYNQGNISLSCNYKKQTYKGFRWSYTPLEAPNT